MKFTGLSQSLAACSLLLACNVMAAAPPSPESIGVAVGQTAPAFKLQDQNDQTVELSQLLKKGPVAVVFFRSADW